MWQKINHGPGLLIIMVTEIAYTNAVLLILRLNMRMRIAGMKESDQALLTILTPKCTETSSGPERKWQKWN